MYIDGIPDVDVSTHSRPKAAGVVARISFQTTLSFNTQPPEGGWRSCSNKLSDDLEFQHTAARRRLVALILHVLLVQTVSTHSRPKAAGPKIEQSGTSVNVSTHSRPKAAGFCPCSPSILVMLFRHTAA